MDTTIEGVLRANRNNPQGGGIVPEEVSAVILGTNQYKQGNGSDDEALKMIYDGKLYTSTRKGEDASNYVSTPALRSSAASSPSAWTRCS